MRPISGDTIALNRQSPWPILRNVSWEVLPLVAGLFVLVEGLDRTGIDLERPRGIGEFASHSSTYAGTGTVRYTW
jgi:arsenical pump membrane protein